MTRPPLFDSFPQDPWNGQIITILCKDICQYPSSIRNVLFIRTMTTGAWMDKIELDRSIGVTRICYTVDKHNVSKSVHPDTRIVDHSSIKDMLFDKHGMFDLICLDPFHEYSESRQDLELCVSVFLNDDGIVLCHDCLPASLELSTASYTYGAWCGVTYAAFVDVAYHYPDFGYTVLAVDTGIGILTKHHHSLGKDYIRELCFTKRSLDRTKQEKMLTLLKKREYNRLYEYYVSHGTDIINRIDVGCRF